MSADVYFQASLSSKYLNRTFQKQGPFQIKFRRIEHRPGIKSLMEYEMQDVRTHFSQKQPIYSGNATQPFHLDDSLSVRSSRKFL